jgi:hypothetical protein
MMKKRAEELDSNAAKATAEAQEVRGAKLNQLPGFLKSITD